MTETCFTMFVHTDNIKDIETLDEYLILTQKPCVYADNKYYIIVFTVLDETPECYDPETMLEVMGGLVVHEDGSNCFLALESDIPEIEKIFGWDGGGHILMGELLTANDKMILLNKKQKKEGYAGDIKINLGSRQDPSWFSLNRQNNGLFEDKSTTFQLGNNAPVVDVWWPFLVSDDGGFNFVIQTLPSDEPKKTTYPLANTHPNPFNPDDDDYFMDYDDYNYRRYKF